MKEWYLIGQNTKPNAIGGYENQSFLDCKDDAFSEVLETDMASSVILYNGQLKNPRTVRCIVQGNTGDTQLKSMERTLLFQIGTVKAGEYVFFENGYWLITGYPGNNKIYEKATAVFCQYLLRWQDESGKIIERWVNLTSASKYDVGETGNTTIILSSNNFSILLPSDDETLELEGKRVFIDQRKNHPTRVFKITRNDDSLYEYGEHGSILSLIADKTEINFERDNQELMICDYIEPAVTPDPVEPEEGSVIPKIEYKGAPELKVGGNYKSLTGYFVDQEANEVSGNGIWDVISTDEILQFVETKEDANTIKIRIADSDGLIGGKVRLMFTDTNTGLFTYLDFAIVGNI